MGPQAGFTRSWAVGFRSLSYGLGVELYMLTLDNWRDCTIVSSDELPSQKRYLSLLGVDFRC